MINSLFILAAHARLGARPGHGALVVGVQSVKTTPMDVFPEFAPPLVEVQTEAPGLSTEEVENLITVPLENALNGTSWLKTIRSKSVLGLPRSC